MSLGDEIRAARLTREWSQQQLAEAAGVSRPTVARVEGGEDVSTATLEKVAGVLGMRLALFTEPGRRVRSRVALPEDAYLARIGEIAYTVSYMEWTLLGDLHRLADQLPDSITLASLEPLTTGQIAARVRSAAEELEDGRAKDYLSAVSEALRLAARLRNDVLHARPATHPAQDQRLTRAEVAGGRTTGARFWIDDAWLDGAIGDMNKGLSAVSVVRPPL